MLDGFHAVKHAVRFGAPLVELLTSDPGRLLRLTELHAPDLLDVLPMQATQVDAERLATATGRAHPTGVVGLARRPPAGVDPRRARGRTAPVVLLENPRHPGNLGAVIRVAAAAGAGGVLTVGGADPWSPAALRGAAGLQYALPVVALPPGPGSLAQVEGPLVALDPDGAPWSALPDDAVVCLGTERDGLSPDLRGRCERAVALPMRTGVSSLNLATAAAAALYLWRLSLPPTPSPGPTG